MQKYKPSYMGQVMPADDPSKLTDFVANKYDAFSKCYDSSKEFSESINAVSATNVKEGTEFSMKLDTGSKTMERIKEKVQGDPSISVSGDTITAKA